MGKITKDEILHLGEKQKDEILHHGDVRAQKMKTFILGVEFEQALPTFEYDSKEHRYMSSRHTGMDAVLGL
jgi:hypothetical protein